MTKSSGQAGPPSNTHSVLGRRRAFIITDLVLRLLRELKMDKNKKRGRFTKKQPLFNGTGGGTRTHTESPPADFESATSTIPSHRHILSRNSQNSHRREQGENSLQKPYFIVTGKP